MRAVRGKNTAPEIAARKAAHRLGLRFRLHRSDLPGSPDMVLPKYRTVFFIHGCFWHGHRGCRRSRLPKTNPLFWKEKIRNNRRRDKRACADLQESGWRVVTLWECELRNADAARTRVSRELAALKRNVACTKGRPPRASLKRR
ncbi:DNA mismatch endonuclease Vsr [Rubrivivax sp. JA1024]|nr:DNA mismatch endonuclease Vsr [Rubrivivax sp. JA1024]